eukprot:gene55981-53765_t
MAGHGATGRDREERKGAPAGAGSQTAGGDDAIGDWDALPSSSTIELYHRALPSSSTDQEKKEEVPPPPEEPPSEWADVVERMRRMEEAQEKQQKGQLEQRQELERTVHRLREREKELQEEARRQQLANLEEDADRRKAQEQEDGRRRRRLAAEDERRKEALAAEDERRRQHDEARRRDDQHKQAALDQKQAALAQHATARILDSAMADPVLSVAGPPPALNNQQPAQEQPGIAAAPEPDGGGQRCALRREGERKSRSPRMRVRGLPRERAVCGDEVEVPQPHPEPSNPLDDDQEDGWAAPEPPPPPAFAAPEPPPPSKLRGGHELDRAGSHCVMVGDGAMVPVGQPGRINPGGWTDAGGAGS